MEALPRCDGSTGGEVRVSRKLGLKNLGTGVLTSTEDITVVESELEHG
jgi:hypothetical protein